MVNPLSSGQFADFERIDPAIQAWCSRFVPVMNIAAPFMHERLIATLCFRC